jgi:hypothetical protein
MKETLFSDLIYTEIKHEDGNV